MAGSKKKKIYDGFIEIPAEFSFQYTILTAEQFEEALRRCLAGSPLIPSLKAVGVSDEEIKSFKLYCEMASFHENAKQFTFLQAAAERGFSDDFIELRNKANASDTFEYKHKYIKLRIEYEKQLKDYFDALKYTKEDY